MTPPSPAPDEQPPRQPAPGRERGEVLISGLDTGPDREERQNVTPTDEHARLQARSRRGEPSDEDG